LNGFVAAIVQISDMPHLVCWLKPHCKDDTDETWHAVGSSWRNSACMDCTCSGCCSNHCALIYSIPRSFPSDCEKVFDQNACEYRVLKKNDPSVECPIYESPHEYFTASFISHSTKD
uniref:Beta-microseminoprotein-like n=1 Tax=Cynoglossus semilaevis TaxID=244447 RepID=A0A3P8WCU8_CYNSE